MRRSFGKKDPLPVTSLEDCLASHTRSETLSDSSAVMCSTCKKKRKSLKRITIDRFPQVLVVHLKRFVASGGRTVKLNAPVTYPLEGLDMSTYGTGNQDAPRLYDLVGRVNHFGSLHGGHYTACVKGAGDKWYTFNDAHVEECDESGSGDEPYLLFYRRRKG